MDSVFNENECNKITEMVFELTNRNYKNVNVEKLSQLHQLCGTSELCIERLYTLLVEYMKKPHSEIRYNAFYVFNHFFKMQPLFQCIAVQDLKSILDLCTDVNPDSKLPPPQAAAKELKRFFLTSIKKWMDEFGYRYRKLQLMYEYLLRKKHVDFATLEMEDLASVRRREQEKLKKEKFEAEKLKSLQNEINDQKLEIHSERESLEACIRMLIPTPEEFFIFDETESTECVPTSSRTEESSLTRNDPSNFEVDVNPASFRETGMLKGNYSVDIHLPKVSKVVTVIENDENAIIIENVKDQFKLVNKKLERVKSWIKKLTTLSGSASELKITIDLKNSLERTLRKYECLVFEKPKSCPTNGDDDSSEDEEMEDVIPVVPTADEELMAQLRSESDPQQPSTSGTCHSVCENDPSEKEKEDRKRKLLEVAPKVPFDVDLYYWEEENLSTPMLHPVTAEGRNFWLATAADDTTEGIPVPDGAASLRTRTIEFVGKFEPVKWHCRFPLPNGKLCPRQDRFKCPFHGTIVARDHMGKCAKPEHAKKDEELLSKLEFAEAQDPELLAQIKMATGVDLKIPEKGKRRKKADESGLTNIKKELDTVHRRLEKKLFKRSTVKRVAKTLDNLDHRRFTDKFGDQFQYVHATTLG